MWELIEQNRQKSVLLFFCMFLILVTLGFCIGYYVTDYFNAYNFVSRSNRAFTTNNMGGLWGAGGAVALWLILSGISLFFGDSIILNSTRAIPVSKDEFPQLFNIVEEMKIASSWQYMPQIYLINDDALNAFATGIKEERPVIAVTAGLVDSLNRDELQGVIAHEMSHIINRDVLFMTFAGVMLGSITIISRSFLRGVFYSGEATRRSKFNGPGGNPAIAIFTLLFAALAPILAQLFYFAVSRKREYLADATAVRLTRYPEGLASALEKIAAAPDQLTWYDNITAPMFIIDPRFTNDRESFLDLGSTHPPTHMRIKVLRKLEGAGFRDYQKTYSTLVKGDFSMLPASALSDKTAVPFRAASADEPVTEPATRKVRNINDLLMAANGFLFMPCSCGLKIKVPPTIGKTNIQCPRCGKFLTIPSVTSGQHYNNKEEALEKTAGVNLSSFTYVRKNKSWESFLCECGQVLQLSPIFAAQFLQCKKCGRKIEIKEE